MSCHNILLFLVFFPVFLFSAGNDPNPSASLILESANNNENTISNGELVSILRGNVVFVYDDIRIRSDEATWWRTKGAIQFRNRIRVVRGRQVITCNAMNFSKDNNTLFATGNFDYFDSTEQSRLKGNEAQYQFQKKTFLIKGNPVLIRYDTAQSETLTIKSATMQYVDSLKCATGNDSVRISKGKLHATCRTARYFTASNIAHLRGNPDVRYDIHRLTGDSVNLTFDKESLRDASVMGLAHGVYADTGSGKTPDTAWTHIWGDSLYIAISDSGFLEVIWSVGRAKSKSYENSNEAEANVASGKIMMLGFNSSGEADLLKIWGSASSTYFVEDRSGKGCNEVSGDSVAVTFANGKVRFVALAGGTRGVYFPLP
jgi:lipopolysaccharide export system protein LptA